MIFALSAALNLKPEKLRTFFIALASGQSTAHGILSSKGETGTTPSKGGRTCENYMRNNRQLGCFGLLARLHVLELHDQELRLFLQALRHNMRNNTPTGERFDL
jgi:hypothetical protein